MIRLQKVIADAGICSRRKAEVLIQEGKVSVNGRLCRTLGTKVDPARDAVSVMGKHLKKNNSDHYYMFYKPRHVLTTLSDPRGRPTVSDFIKKIPTRLFPVGRLDFESEGLILLTNDGDFMQRVAHPSGNIVKRYHVQVAERITQKDIETLRQGAKVEGKHVRPLDIKRIKRESIQSWLEFSLSEGRKREIRVLCDTAGLTVKRLIRQSIGGLSVSGLRSGELRPLSDRDLQAIFQNH
jgi:23S rRNA pseudouridine2605 synthase